LGVNKIQNTFIVNAATKGSASDSLSAYAVCCETSSATRAAKASMTKPNARSNADGGDARLHRVGYYRSTFSAGTASTTAPACGRAAEAGAALSQVARDLAVDQR